MAVLVLCKVDHKPWQYCVLYSDLVHILLLTKMSMVIHAPAINFINGDTHKA